MRHSSDWVARNGIKRSRHLDGISPDKVLSLTWYVSGEKKVRHVVVGFKVNLEPVFGRWWASLFARYL
jgi:hypothetical protein